MTFAALRVLFVMLPILISSGCTKVTRDQMTVLGRAPDIVRGSDTIGARIPSWKTSALPVGDVIKQWRWDQPWTVRNEAGEAIRHLSAPDGAADSARGDGPQLTVIHDPQRGTIYEVYFVQRTDKVFDLPVKLHFYASRDAARPLFSLSFIDGTVPRCQQSRISRGGIQSPGVARALLESAEWVAVGWDSVPYEAC